MFVQLMYKHILYITMKGSKRLSKLNFSSSGGSAGHCVTHNHMTFGQQTFQIMIYFLKNSSYEVANKWRYSAMKRSQMFDI